MLGVDALVGVDRGGPGLCGVEAPANARVLPVGRIGVEAVGELREHEAHMAEVATRHHRAHVPHEGIARIPVVDGEDPVRLPGGRDERLGVFDRGGERLFAQDVAAGLEERPRDLEMRAVGGGDGHEVRAFGTVPLSGQHLAPRPVRPLPRDAEPLRERAPARRIDVEGAGDEIERAVEAGADAVGAADLAVLAAPHEAPLESLFGHALASLSPPVVEAAILALRMRRVDW